jgi:hypothetical protein
MFYAAKIENDELVLNDGRSDRIEKLSLFSLSDLVVAADSCFHDHHVSMKMENRPCIQFIGVNINDIFNFSANFVKIETLSHCTPHSVGPDRQIDRAEYSSRLLAAASSPEVTAQQKHPQTSTPETASLIIDLDHREVFPEVDHFHPEAEVFIETAYINLNTEVSIVDQGNYREVHFQSPHVHSLGKYCTKETKETLNKKLGPR